jgi:hypothetical protein
LSRNNGKRRYDAPLPLLDRKASLDDEAGAKKHATLYSLLAPGYKDGECVRLGATVRIRVVGCRYMVTVSCETEEVQTTLLLPTLEELLEKVEQLLNSPDTVWLPDFNATKRARQQARR